MDDLGRAAPWAGAGLAMIAGGAWILRTAIILHNKKIATEEDQRIVVPSWYYAACVVFLSFLADALLGGGLVVGLGKDHLLEALILAIALRLVVHAAVLAWLLAAGFRSAMIVQVFEIAIAFTLAPVVGSIAMVVFAQ
jgi:hypothetical protein